MKKKPAPIFRQFTPEEKAKMQRMAKEGCIVIADQTQVTKFQAQVQELLEFIGHPEALVTDESCMTDFDAAGKRTWRRRFQKKYGGPLPPETALICDLAKQIAQSHIMRIRVALP